MKGSKLFVLIVPLLLAVSGLLLNPLPAPAQSGVIDFETPLLAKTENKRTINPYASGEVSFSTEGGDGVIGLVKNNATSACAEPADENQKLGTGTTVDPSNVGLSGFAIRATFRQPIPFPATVSVEFQTGLDAPIRLRLFDSKGNEVGSTSDTASPAAGTCGNPGAQRARKTVSADSTGDVAYAIMDSINLPMAQPLQPVACCKAQPRSYRPA